MEDNDPRQVTEMRPVEVPEETVQEPDAEHDQHVVRLERQEVRRSGGLIAAFFGRQKIRSARLPKIAGPRLGFVAFQTDTI